jgi:hypothetical protein
MRFQWIGKPKKRSVKSHFKTARVNVLWALTLAVEGAKKFDGTIYQLFESTLTKRTQRPHVLFREPSPHFSGTLTEPKTLKKDRFKLAFVKTCQLTNIGLGDEF